MPTPTRTPAEGDYDDPTAVLTGEWGPEPARQRHGPRVNPTDE